MWLLLVLFSIPIIVCILFFGRLDRKLSCYPKVPGYPIIENLLTFLSMDDMLDNCMEYQRKYGNMVKLNLFAGFSALLITDVEAIEFILGTTQILNKGVAYKFTERWLGESLLTAEGRKWRKTRKIITPAFHFQILHHYVETFHSASETLIEQLKPQVGKGAFDIYPYITLCALDVVCESAMGIKVNAQINQSSEYVHSIKEMLRIVAARSLNPFKAVDFLYMLTKDYRRERKALKIINSYNHSVLARKKKEFKDSDDTSDNKKKLAFLDMMLRSKIDGRDFTDQEINDELATFMFGGHDTTGTGISFALYCLSTHTDIQNKVVEELHNIFSDDPNRPATLKDLNEMKYLELVIKEALRLYPPGVFMSRQPERDVKHKNFIFPYFSQLTIFIYGVHHNPEYYEDPEKFIPERFLPENQMKRHPFSYLAFSAGPRNCIGAKFAMLELKSTISHILRHYKLLPVENYKPHLIPLVILKAKNGVLVKLEDRKDLTDLIE